MGKNRVAPDRPIRKRDNFFTKTQTNFKAKHKREQFNTKPSRNSENRVENRALSTNSGFFVTSTEREVAKNTNIKAKPADDAVNESSAREKKPFDKKTWRLQKYSKKYKLQQWEDKRKKAVLRGYYKCVKDDDNQFDVQKIYEEDVEDEEEGASGSRPLENRINLNENNEKNVANPESKTTTKKKAFKKAHLEFERLQTEKQLKKEEALKKKQERQEALKEYKKKKSEKYKKLSKKTKKGQPIMKDRMEMLLEKIQKSIG